MNTAPALRRSLEHLHTQISARAALDDALLSLADDWADSTGDVVALTLAHHAQLGGRRLAAVLSATAASARAEVAHRRDVDAEQASLRRGTKIVLGVVVATVAVMKFLSPTYLAFYTSPTGQLLLVPIIAVFVAAIAWMSRLAQFPTQPRVLARDTEPAGPS
jgi:Flp pilus assembly protein TadB